MSILSCFGGAAESVRDMYLNRLQGATEVSSSNPLYFIVLLCELFMYVINVLIIGPEAEGVHFGVFVSLCGGTAGSDRDVSKCPTH